MWRRGAGRDPALVGSSAALLILAFPPFDLSLVAWVALVPLILVVRRSGRGRAAGYAFCCGFVFLSSLWWWLLVPWWNGGDGGNPLQGPLGFLVVTGLVALYLGAFGLGARWLMRRLPGWSVLSLPTLWVLLEYERSHPTFAAIPFGVLGYSQHAVPGVARLASVTSVYGVSFLLLAANALVAEVVHGYLTRTAETGRPPRTTPLLVSTATFVMLAVLWSASLLPPPQSARAGDARVLKVALVQAPVPSSVVDPRERILVFRRYEELSLRAARESADLIVWPSSTVGAGIPADRPLVLMLSELARRTRAFLLVGSAGQDKTRAGPARWEDAPANSAFLFSPEGRIVGHYDKIRLLPFDEYLPLRRYVGWPPWIASIVETDARAGAEPTVFVADGRRFGVQICYENFFPGDFRRVVARDVDFMVGMTNEEYIASPAIHRQHAAMYLFRSIENRIPMLRTSTTGLSGVIDSSGRVVAKVDGRSPEGDPEGYLVASVTLEPGGSLYSRYGDWFIVFLLALLASLAALAWARGSSA
jgi:apolipoprotein N-acyltransferase